MSELLHSLLRALSPYREAAEKRKSRFEGFFFHFMNAKSKQRRKDVIAEFGLHTPQQKCTVPGEYSRDDLMVEMIEDAVSYAVSRGMQCWEVRLFLHLYCEVMESICSKGTVLEECTLTNSTHLFKQSFQSQSILLSPNAAIHTSSYIVQTLLRHFHLYHYLLNHTQFENTTFLNVQVHTPEVLLPLDNGIEASKWEMREKTREIEARHSTKQNEELDKRENELKYESVKKEEVYHSVCGALQSNDITEEDVGKIIDSMATVHVGSTLTSLSHHMKLQEMSVGLQIDKLELKAQPQPASSGSVSPSKDMPLSSRASGRKSKK